MYVGMCALLEQAKSAKIVSFFQKNTLFLVGTDCVSIHSAVGKM